MNNRMLGIERKLGRTTPEYDEAVRTNADRWIPACGGLETSFFDRNQVEWLYCYNPKQRKHAYLNVELDLFGEAEIVRPEFN